MQIGSLLHAVETYNALSSRYTNFDVNNRGCTWMCIRTAFANPWHLHMLMSRTRQFGGHRVFGNQFYARHVVIRVSGVVFTLFRPCSYQFRPVSFNYKNVTIAKVEGLSCNHKKRHFLRTLCNTPKITFD